MTDALARWMVTLEAAGFDVVDDDGAIVGRRDADSLVEVLAVDQTGRVLLTVTSAAGTPVDRTENILGVPASIVVERTRTVSIRLEAPAAESPAALLAALLEASTRER